MMKNKVTLSLSVAALCLFVNTAYAGGGGNWYFGADLGSTHNNTEDNNIFNNNNCDSHLVDCSTDDKDKAARIVAGYEITPSLAVEVAYADLGKTMDFDVDTVGATIEGEQETKALSVAAVGKKQLGGSKVSATAKLGAAYWDSEMKTSSNLPFPNETRSKSGVDPMVGLGLEYAVAQNWNLRAGWDRYYSVGERNNAIDAVHGNVETVDTDVDMYYIGATFDF
ncbi:MAG: outer membrane beta-barrel protein [bacterium]